MNWVRFRGSQSLRHLTMATWEAELEQIDRALPPGFDPLDAGGCGLVSLVGFRARDVRLGGLPAPPYTGVNLRAYVRDREGEPAIFILQSRVTPTGMGAILLGLPVRTTMISAEAGALAAPGMGVAFAYDTSESEAELPPLDPPIGELEVVYWRAAGIRRLETRHAPVVWLSATRTAASMLDPVLAHGFDVKEPRWIHYAERVDFELELPPRKISRR